MFDRFDREIHYLRISVTNRCNLRCSYCVPDDYIEQAGHCHDDLDVATIEKVARAAAEIGINKVRLTGGEPLFRRDIVEIVQKIGAVPGITELGVTTNAIFMPRYAADLRKAGLRSCNISLDTLDAELYRSLSRNGNLKDALAGIDAARQQGFAIKINMVVLNETADEEIQAMNEYCLDNGFTLQLINHYDLHQHKTDNYTFNRPPKCLECNRIRLLADGSLKPCLHSNDEIALDPDDIRGSLERTVMAKPRIGQACTNRSLFEIGG